MDDDSREIRVVKSLLNDVENSCDRIKQENIELPSRLAEKILGGDLKIAKKDIQKIKKSGVDVSSLEADFFWTEGRLCFEVANTPRSRETIDNKKKYAKKAIDAFKNCLKFGENYAAHYNMGIMYDILGDLKKAIKEFKIAEQSSDDDISIEATKNVKRLEESKNKNLGFTIGCLAILIIFILYLIFAGSR